MKCIVLSQLTAYFQSHKSITRYLVCIQERVILLKRRPFEFISTWSMPLKKESLLCWNYSTSQQRLIWLITTFCCINSTTFGVKDSAKMVSVISLEIELCLILLQLS